MLRTKLTEEFDLRYPIVLGGMGSGTNVELVVAVSEAGGLGILGGTNHRPDKLRELIREIRDRTAKPFGINLLLAFADEEQLQVCLDERIPLLSTAWGEPRDWFERAHRVGVPAMHMVPNVADAKQGVAAGADFIVAQGSEGGGHVGHVATFPLVPLVVDAVAPIPVIAAGGIADGRGLAAALMLGAEGVLMGTRFLATPEAPVPEAYKRAIVDASESDTLFTQIPDLASERDWPGAWVRVLRTEGVARWLGREDEVKRRSREINAGFVQARAEGNTREMSILAGQISGLVRSIQPAGEIVRDIGESAERLLQERIASLRTSTAH